MEKEDYESVTRETEENIIFGVRRYLELNAGERVVDSPQRQGIWVCGRTALQYPSLFYFFFFLFL